MTSTITRGRHLGRGYALYLTGALCFALNGSVSKAILLSGIDTARLSQFRVTAAFVVMLVVVAVTNAKALRLTKAELPMLLLYGILGMAMTQWLYFVAISLLPVGVALLIEFTAPLMVALWYRFAWHQPMRPRVWVALVLALFGLALVAQVWQGFTLNAIGVTAAFGAGAALAVYYLTAHRQLRVAEPRDPVSLTMWGFGAASLFWAIVQPWWSFPWQAFDHQAYPIGASQALMPIWALATYMVILGTVVPFWLVLASQRHLSAAQASAVGMLEPILATIIAWALLGETLVLIQIVGAVVVLFGVWLAERSR